MGDVRALSFDSVPLRRLPPYVMPPPDRGLAVRVFHLSVALVLAGSLLALRTSAAVLGGEEWAHPPADFKGTERNPNRVFTGSCLQRLVHECSRRLGGEELRCEDDVGAQDNDRAPHVNTHPSCGSEVFLTPSTRAYIIAFVSRAMTLSYIWATSIWYEV